jgi:hypothetical protein
LAKVHAYIIHALRKDMPAVFGKESKKKELIKNLDQLYGQIQREHQVKINSNQPITFVFTFYPKTAKFN